MKNTRKALQAIKMTNQVRPYTPPTPSPPPVGQRFVQHKHETLVIIQKIQPSPPPPPPEIKPPIHTQTQYPSYGYEEGSLGDMIANFVACIIIFVVLLIPILFVFFVLFGALDILTDLQNLIN